MRNVIEDAEGNQGAMVVSERTPRFGAGENTVVTFNEDEAAVFNKSLSAFESAGAPAQSKTLARGPRFAGARQRLGLRALLRRFAHNTQSAQTSAATRRFSETTAKLG